MILSWILFIVFWILTSETILLIFLSYFFSSFFSFYFFQTFFLQIFRIFEPKVFDLCPKIPAIFLPWKLSENFYYPNHVTLVLFSILNSCLIGPVIEESVKLFFLQSIIRNKRKKSMIQKLKIDKKIEMNTLTEKENKKEVNDIKVPNESSLEEFSEHSLRSYMTIMTAVCLGIKVTDNTRRILLYTHSNQKHKMFFSIARSFFPGSSVHTFIYLFIA